MIHMYEQYSEINRTIFKQLRCLSFQWREQNCKINKIKNIAYFSYILYVLYAKSPLKLASCS
jgi:hypothetical protein